MALKLRESFCESGEGVRLPREGADLQGSPGNFRGSPGNFRGSLGNFRGTSGLLLSSTVRELPGKSPKNFQGSVGNFPGSLETFQKLGGARLPPSDSLNFSAIHSPSGKSAAPTPSFPTTSAKTGHTAQVFAAEGVAHRNLQYFDRRTLPALQSEATIVDPEILQRGFGLIFFIWAW